MDRSKEGKFLRLIHLDLTLLLGLLAISGTGLVVLYSAGQRDLDLVTATYDAGLLTDRGNEYLLDGKGGETLLPANVKEYSSWAKTEVAAAGEHGLTESFSYPRLDITRENFTMLAMNLNNKI